MAEFADIYAGQWILAAFVSKLEETGSAYESMSEISGITQLGIHPKNLKGDSLYIFSGYNNHEGYGFFVWDSIPGPGFGLTDDIFESRQGPQYALDYVLGTDTLLSIKEHYLDQDSSTTIAFQKILDSTGVTGIGVPGYDLVTRNVMLKGHYLVLDSAGSNRGIAHFDGPSGAITNFDFGHYTFSSDPIRGPSYSGDYIQFSKGENNYSTWRHLVFIAENDTIFLHQAEEVINSNDYLFELGNVVYYLLPHKE